MIRIPFFFHPDSELGRDSHSLPPLPREALASERDRIDRVEARLSTLEERLVSHAEELKSNIGNRVMRIQSRVERAIKPFEPSSERRKGEGGADNILEFGTDRPGTGLSPGELHARNAQEALLELNETLRDTREHLEALFGSIDRMKRSMPSGR